VPGLAMMLTDVRPVAAVGRIGLGGLPGGGRVMVTRLREREKFRLPLLLQHDALSSPHLCKQQKA